MTEKKSVYRGDLEIALIDSISVEVIVGRTSLVTVAYEDDEGTTIAAVTVVVEPGEGGLEGDALGTAVSDALAALTARLTELGLTVKEAAA
ncbi:hypothetical protein [Mycetocola spongiae]|uniref:hypothetical protein n=1 Tax=Mycetocola spongiae TaxID=2859226 RepID=UPI001CF42CD1|nr:hypothetical protein [Mycetocola spongiae]UCR89269.1 hypothetical protein KXZ72_00705 [Mycetocola spongiae]